MVAIDISNKFENECFKEGSTATIFTLTEEEMQAFLNDELFLSPGISEPEISGKDTAYIEDEDGNIFFSRYSLLNPYGTGYPDVVGYIRDNQILISLEKDKGIDAFAKEKGFFKVK